GERRQARGAYDRGLDFLADKARDGAFALKKSEYPSAGASALCLLPFLERPGGVREKDKALVDRSLAFLAGSLGVDGGVKSGLTSTYETSVVIMALVASKRPEH